MQLTRSLRRSPAPEKVHGLLFDAAIILGHIFLFRAVPVLGDGSNPVTGGAFLIAAFGAQLIGAWMKARPLSARLRRSQNAPDGLAWRWMRVLLLFHFVLFTLVLLSGLAFLGIYRPGAPAAGSSGDLWVLAGLAGGGLSTFLVWGASRAAASARDLGVFSIRLEYLADLLLWLSAGIVTRIFWEGVVLLLGPARGMGMGLEGMILVLALSWLFAFFYLPTRFLFLVEDFRSPWTWVQIWVAMLPAAWMVVAG